MTAPPGSRPPHARRPAVVPRAVSPRIAALTPAQVDDRWWADIRRTGTPVVEPDPDDPRYRIVTFLWRDRHGAGPGTRAVLVSVNKVTDRSDPATGRLSRVDGTDLWAASWRLRADWRGSYRIAADDADPLPDDNYWTRLAATTGPDPYNRRRMPDRWGGTDLSIGALPDAPAQPWWAARPDVPAGTMARHRLPGDGRPVWVYTPPGHRLDHPPYPVLVLLDGEMWGGRMPVTATLDNLIAEGRIPPMVALLPAALDLPTRRRELTCDPGHLDLLTDTLLPWASRRWRVTGEAARTLIAGQSLGGLAAAYAGLRAPHRFGAVVAQSGSFWWPSDTEFDAGANRLARWYATEPRRPVRLYLETGLLEGATPARHLRDVLDARGYDLTYHEYYGGHDYACWRGGLATALVTLAGGWPCPAGPGDDRV